MTSIQMATVIAGIVAAATCLSLRSIRATAATIVATGLCLLVTALFRL